MDLGAIIFIAFAITIGGIFWYNKTQGDKKAAAQKAAFDEMWRLDYHNPAGPNYDGPRVAAEEAAAWAVDPTNPASPNYDPNYDPEA